MNETAVPEDPRGREGSHRGRVRGFWAEYRGPVFWHYDAKLGYVTAVAAWVLLTSGPAARAALSSVAASGITVSALGLTFVLASLSLLSAMLNPDLVAVLDAMERRMGRPSFGLEGLVVAFRATAAVAALALGAWLFTQVAISPGLHGNGWEAAEVIFGGLAAGLTAWLAAALFGLVGIIATLVRGKAQLTRQRDEAPRPCRSA